MANLTQAGEIVFNWNALYILKHFGFRNPVDS